MDSQGSENRTDSDTETRARPSGASRLDVTGTQVCASTMASVSAAVVASIFGVAGTVIGAAVVSVFATIGSALYGHGIRQTGAKLQQTQAIRLARPFASRRGTGASRDTGDFDADDSQASGPGHSAPGWKDWLSRRRWGVAVGIAIVFVVSLGTVTLIELVGQQPLAGISGNDPSGSTSIGSLFDAGGQDTPSDTTTTTDAHDGTTPTDADEPSEGSEPSTTTGPDSTIASSTTTDG